MKVRKPTKLFAEAKESVVMALNAIAAHKLRSSLTLLGVLVGVFSIIVTMTAMRVLKSDIEREISQLGVNSFSIRKFPAIQFSRPDGFESIWRRKNISLAHGKRVEERATLAASVGVEGNFWAGQVETRFEKTVPSVQLFGETPGSFPARGWTVEEGRGLTEADVDNARDVCVLGAALAKNGFPHGSPLGERVKLNGINYTVIGVFAAKGGSLGGQQDSFAVIPITTALNRGGRWYRSLNILVQARDRESYEETVDQVRGILRVVRKVPPGDEDDFEIASNDSMIAQFNTFTRTVRLGVAVVSSIALIAAGIGIMNIMLVSVTERTREIGIRRAIGAKKRNIMSQFIVEAVVLCQVGGIIGVVLGILGGNAVAFFMKVPPAVPVDWIILGLAICSAVGVIFGTYPAFKAANLDPIESLRYRLARKQAFWENRSDQTELNRNMNVPTTKRAGRSPWLIFFSLFFSIFMLVTVACTLITFILPESFLSQARIKVERISTIPQADQRSPTETENYEARLVQTESEVIQSEAILAKVVESLDLNTEWGRRYFDGTKLKSTESLYLLQNRLEVRPYQGANVIEIRAFSETPKEAALIANETARLYADRASQAASGLKVTIIDSAYPSVRPVRPNKPLNIILGMMLGAALGVLIGGVAAILTLRYSRKKHSPPPIS